MEVKFYSDLSKMSIASEITSFELFGDEDPFSISFKKVNLNKVEILSGANKITLMSVYYPSVLAKIIQ